MQPIIVNEGRPPWVRWLAIPAAFLVIALVALAIDTETRHDYIERVRVERVQQEQFEDPDATRFFFETEDGTVVEFSSNGQETLGRDGDGEISVLTFRPDPDGNVGGLIVNEDGTFEPFDLGDDVSGETRIVSDGDGGFTLVRPDGSRTDISIGEDGVEARDEDGEPLDLEKNENGQIDLGDGLGVRETDIELVPEDGNDNQALPETSDSGSSGPGLGAGRNLFIVLVGLLALGGAVWWFVAMKPKFRLRDVEAVVAPVPVVPVNHTSSTGGWDAFEAFVAELAEHPDPAVAIRSAYAYAEQGMGRLTPRHNDQTPFEWCATIPEDEPELARTLRSLTNRYSSVRFADEEATSQQRDEAIADLRMLVREACQ